MSDYVTGFKTADGIKKYDYNSLANLPASVTDVTDTVISPNADYAEVGEWIDGGSAQENRLGYFVTVAEVADNTIKIRKATSTDDIRGVSVYNPAFSGNASKDKYGEDGELLPQYNYIGIMGIVSVIDNGRCTVGGRCMSDDEGTAIPSTNNMGYAVLKRIDGTHVLIAVEPGADMIQRVKTDVEAIGRQLENVDIDSVDPSKVIFGETVYTAYAVGNIALENGKAVLAEKGDNLLNVMKSIWSKDVNPSTTDPSVTLTFSQWGSYEVGNSVTPSYSVSFNKGSYSFDADTGVSVTKWIISDTKGNSHTYTIGSNGNWFRGTTDTGKSPSKGEHPSGSFPAFTVTDGISYKITAKAEHTAGSIPHTSMGKEYAAGQITAKTATKTSNAVTGYRNSFYGVLYDRDPITASNIRSLCDNEKINGKVRGAITASGKALKNGNSFNISIPQSTETVSIYGVFIAYPDKLKELSSVSDYNDSNANIKDDFGDLGTPEIIEIVGAKGYENDDYDDYKVYIQRFPNPYNAKNTYTVKIKGDNE